MTEKITGTFTEKSLKRLPLKARKSIAESSRRYIAERNAYVIEKERRKRMRFQRNDVLARLGINSYPAATADLENAMNDVGNILENFEKYSHSLNGENMNDLVRQLCPLFKSLQGMITYYQKEGPEKIKEARECLENTKYWSYTWSVLNALLMLETDIGKNSSEIPGKKCEEYIIVETVSSILASLYASLFLDEALSVCNVESFAQLFNKLLDRFCSVEVLRVLVCCLTVISDESPRTAVNYPHSQTPYALEQTNHMVKLISERVQQSVKQFSQSDPLTWSPDEKELLYFISLFLSTTCRSHDAEICRVVLENCQLFPWFQQVINLLNGKLPESNDDLRHFITELLYTLTSCIETFAPNVPNLSFEDRQSLLSLTAKCCMSCLDVTDVAQHSSGQHVTRKDPRLQIMTDSLRHTILMDSHESPNSVTYQNSLWDVLENCLNLLSAVFLTEQGSPHSLLTEYLEYEEFFKVKIQPDCKDTILASFLPWGQTFGKGIMGRTVFINHMRIRDASYSILNTIVKVSRERLHVEFALQFFPALVRILLEAHCYFKKIALETLLMILSCGLNDISTYVNYTIPQERFFEGILSNCPGTPGTFILPDIVVKSCEICSGITIIDGAMVILRDYFDEEEYLGLCLRLLDTLIRGTEAVRAILYKHDIVSVLEKIMNESISEQSLRTTAQFFASYFDDVEGLNM